MAIVGIDFDGTIVTHEYPCLGRPLPGAIETLRDLIASEHKLILYTMRSGDNLEEAVQYCKDNRVEFWGINNNPQQKEWTESPKVYCQLYIDDAALGCPLNFDPISNRHAVDWSFVRIWLIGRRLLTSTLHDDRSISIP